MCLIFAALNHHPIYKLIVAANRDEFYNRKTAAASYWDDFPNVVGGRDLEAGGTWMGMSTGGKISMLTNYRDPANIMVNAPSRGHLVADYLEQQVNAEDYTKLVRTKASQYNGFNLIIGTVDELYYLSNYQDEITRLNNGLYGLSNHLLDTPWPKVARGKMKLEPLLRKSDLSSGDLMEFLYDDQVATEGLPDTGIGAERERALSSMFIKTPTYGSRCSTVVLVGQDNRVQFTERVYDLDTFEYTTSAFEFTV
ncbi:MAG TPA: NRDE family protein [Cyclobacteriaceae bacterium]|nr:NRDE family protein [Cyclobacteriaceae bacterium]